MVVIFLSKLINMPEELGIIGYSVFRMYYNAAVPQLKDMQLHIGTDGRGFPHLLGIIDR